MSEDSAAGTFWIAVGRYAGALLLGIVCLVTLGALTKGLGPPRYESRGFTQAQQGIRTVVDRAGPEWPGSSVNTRRLPSGSVLVEHLWMGLPEWESVLYAADEVDFEARPADRFVSTFYYEYGPGNQLKNALLVIVAGAFSMAFLVLTRPKKERSSAAEDG